MYCSKCGEEVVKGAKFCAKCGNPIVQVCSLDKADEKKCEKKKIVANLVERFKQGDNDAYNELYKMYHDQMLRIALRHTQASGRTNMQDAEDVVQDAMIKAYQNIQSLDNSSMFENWLTRIVTNRAKDYMTSAAKRRNVNFTDKYNEEDDIEYDPEDEKGTYQPDVIMEEKTREEILGEIFNELSEEQRIVTIMHFYDDMTLQEIAEELGVEMSTVQGRFQTAKKNIKASVSAIQKRDDIKLYNVSAISAIPFFAYLLGKGNITVDRVDLSLLSAGAIKTQQTTNSANLASEETIKKSTSKIAKKVVESNATEASTSIVGATVSAGTSTATKIAIGIAITVVVGGSGYIGMKLFDKTSTQKNNTSEESTQNENLNESDSKTLTETETNSDTNESLIKENNEKIMSEEGITFSMDIPDGWILKKENIQSIWCSTDIKPIWYLYKGGIDDSNPHIIIDPNDYTNGLGGDDDPLDDEAQYYNHNGINLFYSYSYSNYSRAPLDELPELLSLEKTQERYYTCVLPNDDNDYEPSYRGNESYSIAFIDHGQNGLEDKDFLAVLDSFKVNRIGKITLKVSNLNIRLNASTKSTIYSFSKMGSGGGLQVGDVFNVYSIKENEGYTWYQIGAYTWVADKNGEWVSYQGNF